MAMEVAGVTEVVRQEGDRVLVLVPMRGFPAGFEVRPGTRVVLMSDEIGPAVYPLLREQVVQESLADEDLGGEQMRVGEGTVALQAATIRDVGGGPPYVVGVLERADDDEEQVFGIRSQSQ
jgi:hypothetical protein